MKTIIILAAAAAIGAIAAPAFADSNASLGYSPASVGPYNVGAVTGRFGRDSGFWGIEGEGSLGVGDDSHGVGTSQTTVKLKSEFGAFGTVQADVSDTFQVMGRAGYATADFSSRTAMLPTATRTSDSESGLAYGVGASWLFDGMNGVRLDYTRYNLDLGRVRATSTTTAVAGKNPDVWSLSFVHRFK